MGELDRRKMLDLLLLGLAVESRELTTDEAVDLYMDKWMPGWRDEA